MAEESRSLHGLPAIMPSKKRGRADSEEVEEEEKSTGDVRIRRSLRESKPSAVTRGQEWQLEKKGKFSPTEVSPGRVSRRSQDGLAQGSVITRGSRKLSPHKNSPANGEISPRRTRRSEDGLNSSLKKRSPRSGHQTTRRTRNGQQNTYVESEATDDTDGNQEGQVEDSPFYNTASQRVRFSPSAKVNEKGSPFGRKTRSSRRGLSSYIQSLPSEDEQSEFNRHYKNDLKRRQHRRASEEDKVEDRAANMRLKRGDPRGEEEELSLSTQRRSSRRRRQEEAEREDEEDSEGVGDPTVTESSLRRSTRRNAAAAGGEEADTESGVEKQEDSD